jgi:hypothetical protein
LPLSRSDRIGTCGVGCGADPLGLDAGVLGAASHHLGDSARREAASGTLALRAIVSPEERALVADAALPLREMPADGRGDLRLYRDGSVLAPLALADVDRGGALGILMQV